ncbi:MAG: DUF3365 domain-containing protein [bacterium]|nr:DUF3365 domain-containing protein [bacterium]
MIARTNFRTVATILLGGIVALAGVQQRSFAEDNAGQSPATPATETTAAQTKAVAAKDALFGRLSGRLMEVMKAKGPAAAIEVCSNEAKEIAKAVGKEHGVAIGRTSVKLRSPDNKPPAWVKPLIAKAKAEPQVVDLPHGHTGVLLPIKLKAKCVVCHGPTDKIAADVKTRLAKLYPDDQATGFQEGDLRGWFWIDVPAADADPPAAPDASDSSDASKNLFHEVQFKGPGKGRGNGPGKGQGQGRGQGRGQQGQGRGPGMEWREDMVTLHALFGNRKKIKRAVRLLPDGAESLTESTDKKVAALIKQHVPAMESRVHGDNPLPPMTFHPVFVQLIKHADDYSFTYKETPNGMSVRYKATDPFVIMLVQEHAKLVSRFIANGMSEIHKPYKLPAPARN